MQPYGYNDRERAACATGITAVAAERQALPELRDRRCLPERLPHRPRTDGRRRDEDPGEHDERPGVVRGRLEHHVGDDEDDSSWTRETTARSRAWRRASGLVGPCCMTISFIFSPCGLMTRNPTPQAAIQPASPIRIQRPPNDHGPSKTRRTPNTSASTPKGMYSRGMSHS